MTNPELLEKLKSFCSVYSNLDGVYDKVLDLIENANESNQTLPQLIEKELLMKMKFSDTTLKGVSDSQEYIQNQYYNKGIRDALTIVKKHSKNKSMCKWGLNVDPYGDLKEFICDCGRSSESASNYCPSCGTKMDNSDIEVRIKKAIHESIK